MIFRPVHFCKIVKNSEVIKLPALSSGKFKRALRQGVLIRDDQLDQRRSWGFRAASPADLSGRRLTSHPVVWRSPVWVVCHERRKIKYASV